MDNEGWENLKIRINNDYELLCPQCGFNYIHIIKVVVSRRDDDIIVEKERIEVRKGGSPTRGSVTAIEYVCENNHHGLIIFFFYKGNVEVRHKKLPDCLVTYQDLFRD